VRFKHLALGFRVARFPRGVMADGKLKLVVIGSGGLVGSRMCEKIVAMSEFAINSKDMLPLHRIVLFDVIDSPLPESVKKDPRVEVHIGNLTDRELMDKVLAPGDCTRVTTIQLAALLSGYAEDNFDKGMEVNLHGSLGIMEAVRAVSAKLGSPQIYVFTSTDYVAAYNEANKNTPVSEESFRLSPVSYGVQKACVELLLCDYSRKGFIDGRVARLSAVLGRPGWSNSISWSYTGIFTQTLAGKEFEVPGNLGMNRPYPCSCVRNNVDCLLQLASRVDGEQLGHNRVVQIPAISYTLAQIWKATEEVAAEEGIKVGSIKQGELPKDATVKELNVCPHVDIAKARSLNLPVEVDIKEIIRDFINTHMPEAKKSTAGY